MGYADDYLKLRNKRKKNETNSTGNTSTRTTTTKSNSFAEEYNALRENRITEEEKKSALKWRSDEIAPVKETKKEKEESSWFQKGAFDDGYQFGDVTKTIVGTVADISENVNTAVLDATENLIDTAAYGVGTVGGFFDKDFKDDVGDFIAKEILKPEEWGKKISDYTNPIGYANTLLNDGETEENSVFGDKSDGLVQSGSHLIGTAALQAVGVPAWLTMGVNAFGGEIESAFQNDATFVEAGISGGISAAAEIVFEKISSGIKFGGKTFDEGAQKWLKNNISNKIGRTIAKYVGDMVGEGTEEVLTEATSAVGRKLTYASEKEWNEILSKEDLFDAFIGGAVISGVAGGGQIFKSTKTGRDYVTGLNDSEEKVVNKLYEDAIAEKEKDGTKLKTKEKNEIYDNIVERMDKGDIDIDTIESVLGGETFKEYQSITEKEKALTDEITQLENLPKEQITVKQKRLTEAREELKSLTGKTELKTKLSDEVYGIAKNSRLVESYNEKARKSQSFDADLTKYTGKQKEAVERAVKSGVLNNTNKSHALVDTLSKIEAEKGIIFDYTDNAKLKESGFAVEGKTVNGFESNGTVTLNVQSAKSWQSVVGHEISHVFEGTDSYTELQKALFEFAESKGELETRRANLTELYKDLDADVDKELTADLVGDYLFGDNDFIKGLTTNRNLFQKIYDEIKYLCKVATGKQLTEIEKVKREFDNVWKEFNAEGVKENGTKFNYHISPDFEAEIEKTLNNEMTKNNQVKARDYTPEILVENGVNDLPMLITQNHIKSIIYSEAEAKKLGLPTGKNKNYHGLGKDLLVKSIDNMDSPSEIYKKDENHYLIITELQNSNEEDIIIPVMIDGKGTYNDVYINENQILSAYGKKNLQEYLDKNNFELIYTKKGTALNEGVQYPNISNSKLQTAEGRRSENTPFNQQSVSDGIVTENGNDVKRKYSVSRDSQGNELSKEQQEYFKDSKVRDKKGRLLTVYHGTKKAGFTMFAKTDDIGYFFAKSLKTAKTYSGGSKVIYAPDKNSPEISGAANYKTYLNIKKPYIIDGKGANWNGLESTGERVQISIKTSKWSDDGTGLGKIKFKYGGKTYSQTIHNVTEFEQFITNHLNKDMAKSIGYAMNNLVDEKGKGEFNVGIGWDFKNNKEADAKKTRDIVRRAYNSKWNYDGVIFKNVVDSGDGTKIKADDLYVVFNSNQIKSVANTTPTTDADIRYSISNVDSQGNELSTAVQKRFTNSKAVDENGNLKVLYHGTASGEFYTFDKSKGNVEGDFGSGFYFTDNEGDVEANYEGGGPDFEIKVARRAEQIEQEEEIDYEEAEKRARDELYKGSNKHTVYLNIENPAIVGETNLFDYDSYAENYDREDYDSDEDYEGDVEQLIVDDIEQIIWDIERNIDIYSTDGIAEVLWNAINEGGIDIEQLKANINNLYLEDNNGNLVGNEVTRQIVESLGYDGIIDNTVSSKFNMNLAEDTTHYIVFKPNQIKSIDNQNPTDDPDIRKSLSKQGEQSITTGTPLKDLYLAPVKENAPTTKETTFSDDFAPMPEGYTPMTEEEANALQSEQFESITDMDAPPEVEQPYYGDRLTPDSPFDWGEWEAVGNRQKKAYMYENPEVKPYFQAEAESMLSELQHSTKGEKLFNSKVYYDSNGEYGWSGVSRRTSDAIALLLDSNYKYTYADIEKGLKAIIEDNGKENNAISKRIEFVLDERLREGYTDFESGIEIPPNQDYINLLNAKQITEYSDEAYNNWLNTLTDEDYKTAKIETEQYDNDFAPLFESIAPLPDDKSKNGTYAAIKPKPEKQPSLKKVDNANVDEQTAEVMVEEPKTEKKKGRVWSKIKSNFIDKGSAVEDLSLKTKNRALQDKFKAIGRSETKAQYFMENGKGDVKSLDSIRAEVEKTGHTKEFYNYIYHKHNVDRMSLESKEAPNLKRLEGEMKKLKLLDLQENQLRAIANEKISKETSPKRAELIKTVKEYLASKHIKNKPVFGYPVTAQMSQKIANEYETTYPEFKEYAQDVYNYMNHLRKQLVENGVISQETSDLWAKKYPNYVPIRRLGDAELSTTVPLDTNKTGINAPIKSATGGSRDILPLFDTMAARTIQTFKATSKNKFGVELKNTLGTVVESQKTNIDDVIEGVDTHENLLQEGKNGANPTFTVFEDGKRVTFEITEDLYDALKPTSEGLSYTNKVLNTASNVHRGLLTEYSVPFIFKNAMKDSQDVLINSQHPTRTYANFPTAIKELTTKGEWYTEYMENGGGDNTYFDKQTNTFNKEKSTLRKVIGFPLDKISDANNFIEKIPRLAEYIASRKKGASIDAAMLDAARVTTDFSAGGDVTKLLNRNGATFLNASVQGLAQNVRNVREAKAKGFKGWVGLATKVTLSGLPAVLLNSLLWDDDEEYEELSDYVKDNYYIVSKYGDGKFVRIPKGRVAAVIQDAVEQVGNSLSGNDEADWNNFFYLVMSNLAPNNPIDNNILAPIGQVASNKTWYGEDLVPTRLQDVPVGEQYDESTDSISKWLGEKLSYSPYKINYLLNQYSGGLGDIVLPMITPEAESGDNTIGGNIIAPLKDTFTTDAIMNNQNVSDFYSKVDELSVNANSIKATDEDKLKSKYMSDINSELGDLYKQKREIQNSNLNDSAKYNQVKELQKQINKLAKEGLNTYNDVKIDEHYATVGDKEYLLNSDYEWSKADEKQVKKYKWFKENNISYDDYLTADEDGKNAYTWAYNNPEKYTVSKTVVNDVVEYRSYTSDLNDIRADKDENGESISGSAKEKKIEYINNLDLEYGQKIVLYKMQSKSDDTYNQEIVEYLNGFEDLTYDERITIFTELGFTVQDGYVYWD